MIYFRDDWTRAHIKLYKTTEEVTINNITSVLYVWKLASSWAILDRAYPIIKYKRSTESEYTEMVKQDTCYGYSGYLWYQGGDLTLWWDLINSRAVISKRAGQYGDEYYLPSFIQPFPSSFGTYTLNKNNVGPETLTLDTTQNGWVCNAIDGVFTATGTYTGTITTTLESLSDGSIEAGTYNTKTYYRIGKVISIWWDGVDSWIKGIPTLGNYPFSTTNPFYSYTYYKRTDPSVTGSYKTIYRYNYAYWLFTSTGLFYNSKPYYKYYSFYMWWNNTDSWIISQILGTKDSQSYERKNTNPFGPYEYVFNSTITVSTRTRQSSFVQNKSTPMIFLGVPQ